MSNGGYDAGFYQNQRDASFLAAQKILPIVFSLIPYRSLLDVGCGVGPWVAAALELGIADAQGIDGSWVSSSLLLIPQANFQFQDLNHSFDLARKFDLLICMEVAEHLNLSSASLLVDSLVRHADAVLFGAAIPGQGGTHHVNEQWPEFWREKFARRGYRQFDVIRGKIWNDTEIPFWYRQNAYLFVSEEALSRYPELLGEDQKQGPVAWIHPELFLSVLPQPLCLRQIVNILPSALSTALRNRVSRFLGRTRSVPSTRT